MKYRKKPIIVEAIQWTGQENQIGSVRALGYPPCKWDGHTSDDVIKRLYEL